MLRLACAAIVMVVASSWCAGAEINFSGGGSFSGSPGGSSWSPSYNTPNYNSSPYTSHSYTSRGDSYSGTNTPYTTNYPRNYSYSYREPYNYTREYPYYSDSYYGTGIGRTYWYDSNGYRHYNDDGLRRERIRDGRPR